MLAKLLIAWGLMALSVAIHAAGVSAVLRRRVNAASPQGFLERTRLLVGVAGWMVFLHLVEITIWAMVYVAAAALPDIQSAIYFSAVTYTTTGHGDLTLPESWRVVGGVEALTGILMCGLSTGAFVAVVGRLGQSGRTAAGEPSR